MPRLLDELLEDTLVTSTDARVIRRCLEIHWSLEELFRNTLVIQRAAPRRIGQELPWSLEDG